MLASRAFFRCRACGEPVVAGAYRCPNCSIDFPTGTPGAPRAAQSPADPEPVPSRADAPPPTTAHIAERLESALGELTVPPRPAPSAAEPPRVRAEIIDIVPEPDDVVRDTDAAALGDVRPTAARRTAASTAPAPSISPVREDRDEGDGGEPADTVRPGAELSVSPRRRPGRAVVAEPVSRAVFAAPRRRRGGLGRTLAAAVLLLGAVGAATWWVEEKGAETIELTRNLVPAIAAPQPITVAAEEGWVTVPADLGAVRVSGDGPFRVRVGGNVYTVQAVETVRVAGGGAESVAVRAIRSLTTVRVTPES